MPKPLLYTLTAHHQRAGKAPMHNSPAKPRRASQRALRQGYGKTYECWVQGLKQAFLQACKAYRIGIDST